MFKEQGNYRKTLQGIELHAEKYCSTDGKCLMDRGPQGETKKGASLHFAKLVVKGGEKW